jgi:hypothetical protein
MLLRLQRRGGALPALSAVSTLSSLSALSPLRVPGLLRAAALRACSAAACAACGGPVLVEFQQFVAEFFAQQLQFPRRAVSTLAVQEAPHVRQGRLVRIRPAP